VGKKKHATPKLPKLNLCTHLFINNMLLYQENSQGIIKIGFTYVINKFLTLQSLSLT